MDRISRLTYRVPGSAVALVVTLCCEHDRWFARIAIVDGGASSLYVLRPVATREQALADAEAELARTHPGAELLGSE